VKRGWCEYMKEGTENGRSSMNENWNVKRQGQYKGEEQNKAR